MSAEPTRIVSVAESPDLRDAIQSLGGSPWPEFLLHSRVVRSHWDRLYKHHPECQFALVNTTDESLMAVGNSVPVHWDAELGHLPEHGVEWALESRFGGGASAPPNLLCALQIVIAPKRLNSGLSATMVKTMRRIAADGGLRHLVAPVRPTWKHRYPLLPMERYVRWTRDDGLPYDPWMRVHTRLGAELAEVCPRSLSISGSRADWERWTQMTFPESGDYVLPGGLVPMQFDAKGDWGHYVEPNVWMIHL